jgi:carbon-monoxide dehydrogenase medium subunit
MIPAKFDYIAPHSLDEVLALLKAHGDEAKLLAGGQSLLPLMKLRLGRPKFVIDLSRVPGLGRIREADGAIHIGPMARHASVETSRLLRKKLSILPETAEGIGDPQVRNMGTMGGALAHADPAADYPTVVSLLQARLQLRSAEGERWVDAEDFFVDMMITTLEPAEMITGAVFQKLPPRAGAVYCKLERKAGDFATVGVAALVRLNPDLGVEECRITIGAVGPKPFRAGQAEEFLLGKRPTDALFQEASGIAASAADPETDLRGSREYKQAVTRVYAERAIREAYRRAGGRQ